MVPGVVGHQGAQLVIGGHGSGDGQGTVAVFGAQSALHHPREQPEPDQHDGSHHRQLQQQQLPGEPQAAAPHGPTLSAGRS